MSKTVQKGGIEVMCNTCSKKAKVETVDLYAGKRCSCGGTYKTVPQNKVNSHKSSKEKKGAKTGGNRSGKTGKKKD